MGNIGIQLAGPRGLREEAVGALLLVAAGAVDVVDQCWVAPSSQHLKTACSQHLDPSEVPLAICDEKEGDRRRRISMLDWPSIESSDSELHCVGPGVDDDVILIERSPSLVAGIYVDTGQSPLRKFKRI